MGTRYAQIADARQLGLGARALKDEDAAAFNANLDAASAEADSYLGNQYTLPITVFGSDIKAAVCKIAVYEFLSVRGLNPEPGSADGNVRDRAKDARAWLQMVGAGKATPTGIVDSTIGQVAGSPGFETTVESSSQRGWSSRGAPPGCHRGPFVTD
jgi:phage gp36-like protein